MAKTRTDTASSCIKAEAIQSTPLHEVNVMIEEMSGSNEFDAGCVGDTLPFSLVVKTKINEGNNKVMQEKEMSAGVKTEMPDRTVTDTGSTDTTMFRKGKVSSFSLKLDTSGNVRSTFYIKAEGNKGPPSLADFKVERFEFVDTDVDEDQEQEQKGGQEEEKEKAEEEEEKVEEEEHEEEHESDLDSDYDPLGRKSSTSSESDPDYEPVNTKNKRGKRMVDISKQKHRNNRDDDGDTTTPCSEHKKVPEMLEAITRCGKGGKTSTDRFPYICGVCEKTFNLKRELESHMRRHTEEKPFVCRVCKKRFAHASTLRDHARLHTGLRPYKCEHCDQTYTKPSHLKPHYDRKHSQNVLQCTKCDKTFKTNSDFMKHTRNHDTNVTRKCDLCGTQSLKTKKELNLHISKFHCIKNEKRDKKYCRPPSHAEGQFGERYICDLCQKEFKRKQYLLTHKLSHSNIRPYSCDRCGKAFNDQSNMKRHRLSHDETSMSRQKIVHIEKPRYL